MRGIEFRFHQLRATVAEMALFHDKSVKELFDLAQNQVCTTRAKLTTIRQELDEAEYQYLFMRRGMYIQIVHLRVAKCKYTKELQKAVALRDFIGTVYGSSEMPAFKASLTLLPRLHRCRLQEFRDAHI